MHTPRAYKTTKLKSPERKPAVIPYWFIQPHHITKRRLENIRQERRHFSLLSLLLTHSKPHLVRSSAPELLSSLTLSGRTLNSLTLHFPKTQSKAEGLFHLKTHNQLHSVKLYNPVECLLKQTCWKDGWPMSNQPSKSTWGSIFHFFLKGGGIPGLFEIEMNLFCNLSVSFKLIECPCQ